MNPPWKDNRYSLIQWTCSYHKRRYRIRKTASMQWYNPRLWSYRKTWRNVTHPSDVSASRCRGSLVLATADRNRRLPLCWRAPSCRQKYRKTRRNVTRPIPPTCLPHGVAAACFGLATADKKAETHNHLSIHQWVRSAIFAPQQHASPIGFLFLKLPPPPCAVLLVWLLYVQYVYPIIYIPSALEWLPKHTHSCCRQTSPVNSHFLGGDIRSSHPPWSFLLPRLGQFLSKPFADASKVDVTFVALTEVGIWWKLSKIRFDSIFYFFLDVAWESATKHGILKGPITLRPSGSLRGPFQDAGLCEGPAGDLAPQRARIWHGPSAGVAVWCLGQGR